MTPVNGCSAYKRLPRHLDRRVSLLAQRAGEGHCRMGLARLPRPRRRKPYPSPQRNDFTRLFSTMFDVNGKRKFANSSKFVYSM